MYAVTCATASACWASVRQPASARSFSHATSRANTAELYAAVASTSGVESVIPAAAVSRSVSACFTRVIVAGGTSVVVVVGAAVVALVATLAAAACASASAACAAAKSCSAFATSLWAASIRGRGRRHRFLWRHEIGPTGLHVADGGLAVREELAVAVERGDVVGRVSAELLLCRRERALGRVDPSARSSRCLGSGDGIGA